MTDEKAIEKMVYDQQQGWIKSEDLPPQKEDGDRYGNVLCWYAAAKHAGPSRWDNVALCPVDLPYWMPMPEPPEVEE